MSGSSGYLVTAVTFAVWAHVLLVLWYAFSFSMACFHVYGAQLCLLERFCTSKSLLTMCLLYLGPKESLALLNESWLHTLLGNMLRKHRLEKIIAG